MLTSQLANLQTILIKLADLLKVLGIKTNKL